MADEANGNEALAAGAEESRVDATNNPAENGAAKETESKDELVPKSELNKRNNENKSLRDRLKVAEDALKAINDKDLSESQKLQRQFDELKTGNDKLSSGVKGLLIKTAVSDLKDEFGLRSTKSIVKLIDDAALEFDFDTLSVAGVEKELARIKKEDPDLFIKGGTDGGAGGNGRDALALKNMNDLIRGKAGIR